MGTLLNFYIYTLQAGTWTPILLSGKILKAWLSFPSDIIIGSSPTDPNQQQTLSAADGEEFMIPVPSEVVLPGGTIVCYATAVTGSVSCVLNSIAAP